MTTEKQPEALRLAEACDVQAMSWGAGCPTHTKRMQTAAELRRQHARIAELESIGAGGVSRLVAQADTEPVGTFYVTNFDGLRNEHFEEAESLPAGKYTLYTTPQPAIAPEPTPEESDTELDALRATELVNLITATHKALGRHNTQIAMCNLYAAVGLTSVRPIMTQQQRKPSYDGTRKA